MAEAGENVQPNELEQVQGWVKEQVQQYFDEQWSARQTAQQQEQQRQQQQVVSPDEQQRKQAGDFIRSLVGDDINAAKFSAADAKDEIRFYRSNPDAVEYEAEIEKLFTDAAAAGRPTTRQDLYSWMVGREALTEPDKWTEKQAARKKAQVERAEAATDFGASALNKAKEDSRFADFESKTVEEMEKALEGIAF
jgi:hypothetical protein